MTTDQFKQEQLKKYLSGDIQLIDVKKICGMSHWETNKLVNKMFAWHNSNDDNNFLYDKRMSEVTKQRMEKFTPQEISTQLF